MILILALATYSDTDPSLNLSALNQPRNLLGYFGSYLSDIFYQLFGISSFIIPLSFIIWSYLIYKNETLSWKSLKIISLIMAICCISVALSGIKISYLPTNGGGVFGFYLFNMSIKYLAELQQLIIPAAFLLSILFLILAFGIKLTSYIKFTLYLKSLGAKITPLLRIPKFSIKTIKLANHDKIPSKIIKEPIITGGINSGEMPIGNKPRIIPSSVNQEVKHTEQNIGILPPLNLLDQASSYNIQTQSPAELEAKAEELLAVLADFGVKGKIIDIRQGPVVTMYEFEPAAGTKSSRVIGLSDDIARSLSAHSTRIAVIPGRNALGIELPNKQRMFFRLRELVETEEFQDQNVILPLILGKDLSGRPLVADLAKMPHLLVAGTTGSGKSVAINAMIMSLLYKYTPAECRMIMIDPKMLELSSYDNIPHLMTPVVTEPGT